MAFFETLNFSSSNEDGATEIAALTGCRRILCLTGTGTRALDLLAGDADEVIALDANPVQNAALELKMAAIAGFDRPNLLGFLGIAGDARRIERYESLRPSLTGATRAYWDRDRNVIAKGMWTAGKWEQLLRWNARFLGLFRGPALKALMHAADLDQQAEIWRNHFVPGPLRASIEGGLRDLVWRLAMREPAAAHLPDARTVNAHIAQAFEAASRRFLFSDSDIATLVFGGRHTADGALPVHLRAEHYDLVRARLSRLRIVEGSLARLDATGERDFDGYSLSDFGSYCDPRGYADCWNGVIASAAPGARYCERVFMNDMSPPPGVVIDTALSAQLSACDRSIIYRIRSGTIDKPPRVS